jgi:hypothetical protein
MSRAPIPDCPFCRGTGWVCEEHDTRPTTCASPDHPEACDCGAPGEPCSLCYPLTAAPKERLPPLEMLPLLDS